MQALVEMGPTDNGYPAAVILDKPNIDNGEWMLPASSDTPRQSIDADYHTPFFTKKHEIVFALALC